MDLITIIFIMNAILLILHEIESAYWKEWEILKLPGEITGFILLHIPILFILLYGLVEIARKSLAGNIFGVLLGIGGSLPFIVHVLIVSRKDKFNLPISKALIYANIVTGILLIALSINSFIA